MEPASIRYFPIEWPLLLGLFLLLSFLVLLVELKVLRYAYERMGIPPRFVLAILLLTLVGSSINIPLVRLPAPRATPHLVLRHHRAHYVVPASRPSEGTIVAINVGGALIPTLLSIYLLFKNRLFVRGAIAIAVVALVTHAMAQPVREVGITLPIFIPPIVAVLCALVLSWRRAGPLAYIAGSMGTLIGADLMNLRLIPSLGAPVASIGGAGTFDAVFLVGIVAVLLASLVQPHAPRSAYSR
ncbi:MAG: DUF1614 domain-containing protein [Terracidiphilus sp.]|nr:DUF1614 domain-containing protein [Terracidiphilus sp.]